MKETSIKHLKNKEYRFISKNTQKICLNIKKGQEEIIKKKIFKSIKILTISFEKNKEITKEKNSVFKNNIKKS